MYVDAEAGNRIYVVKVFMFSLPPSVLRRRKCSYMEVTDVFYYGNQPGAEKTEF